MITIVFDSMFFFIIQADILEIIAHRANTTFQAYLHIAEVLADLVTDLTFNTIKCTKSNNSSLENIKSNKLSKCIHRTEKLACVITGEYNVGSMQICLLSVSERMGLEEHKNFPFKTN